METSNYSKMKLFQIISIKVLRKLLALQLSSVSILEAQEYLNLHQLLKVLIKTWR